MSRFRFEIPAADDARDFLAWRRVNGMYQTDLHADALACQRRILPVTTAAERAAVREYVDDLKWSGTMTHSENAHG